MSSSRMAPCIIALSAFLPAAPAAEVFPVDLGLTPPGAVNKMDLTITADTPLGKKSDSDSGTMTGNLLAALGMTFDPTTHRVTSVDTIEFTGGRVLFTDMSFRLEWRVIVVLGSVDIQSSGMGATFDTPAPPGTVTGGQFSALEHEVIIDQGIFTATGAGAVADLLPQNPYTIDLSQEPSRATSDATGTVTVGLPSIAGSQATYTVTLVMPVALDQEVLNDPDSGSTVRILGTGSLEARGTFTRPLPSFGEVVPPMATGFEEAPAGAASFTRGIGDEELAWSLETRRVTGSAAVEGSFVDPDDTGNLHQLHVTNADVDLLTERIDLREGTDPVQVSLGLRTWDTSTGFEAADLVSVAILASTDGSTFTEVPWLSLSGSSLTALNKGRDGAFTAYASSLALVPAGTKTIRVRVRATNDSANEHVFVDGLRVRRIRFEPFRRGDCNADGKVDIADPLKVLFRAFMGDPEPPCEGACDGNDDGKVNVTDAIAVLGYLFRAGSPPPAPGPISCGADPSTATRMPCEAYASCQ